MGFFVSFVSEYQPAKAQPDPTDAAWLARARESAERYIRGSEESNRWIAEHTPPTAFAAWAEKRGNPRKHERGAILRTVAFDLNIEVDAAATLCEAAGIFAD